MKRLGSKERFIVVFEYLSNIHIDQYNFRLNCCAVGYQIKVTRPVAINYIRKPRSRELVECVAVEVDV